jgi:hypothetical protein
LQALGEKLAVGWLDIVSRPRLVGTVWANGGRAFMRVLRFLPDGELNYTSSSGTFQNATWRQIGPVVLMETNNHYADYLGSVCGEQISGSAWNVVSAKWRWAMKRTTDPKVCDTGDPVKKVFSHGTSSRKKKKSSPSTATAKTAGKKKSKSPPAG